MSRSQQQRTRRQTERAVAGRSQQEKAPGRVRGPKYTATEIDYLLDLVESKLPTGGDEWAAIALIFNREIRSSNREGDDLKNKLKSLKNKKKPSGDPDLVLKGALTWFWP